MSEPHNDPNSERAYSSDETSSPLESLILMVGLVSRSGELISPSEYSLTTPLKLSVSPGL